MKTFKELINESAHSKEADRYGADLSKKEKEAKEKRLKKAKEVKLDIGKFKLDYANDNLVAGELNGKEFMAWYTPDHKNVKLYRLGGTDGKEIKGATLSDKDNQYLVKLRKA
jgi:hypothetical protein